MDSLVRFISGRLANERLVRFSIISLIVWSVLAALSVVTVFGMIARTKPIQHRTGRTRIEPLP